MSFLNEVGDLLYISKGVKKEIKKDLIFFIIEEILALDYEKSHKQKITLSDVECPESKYDLGILTIEQERINEEILERKKTVFFDKDKESPKLTNKEVVFIETQEKEKIIQKLLLIEELEDKGE